MHGKRTLVITIALLAMLVTSGWAATLEVTQPVQVTSDSYYERGQSIVYDGTNYWLFYGRSASCTVPYSGGDPDLHDYVTYYKKASTVAGLAAASPASVTGAHNSDSYLGETGAVVYGADVWVFATIDGDGIHTPTADCDLYGWWSNDGGSVWNEVGPIISALGDGQAHHDEIVFDGKLWVLEGASNYTTMYSTTPKTGGWSTPVSVGTMTGGLGHFFVDGTDLYLALGSGGTYYIYIWNTGTSAWDLVDSKTISGYYDPTLFKVGSDYVFYCAPWSAGRQWIVGWTGTTLDGSFFDGPEMDVIEGRYGSTVWTDMWPIGFTSGGTSYLFYSSERDIPSAEGAGNIWYTEVDWDVSNDHYTYLKEAVGSAAAADEISVAAGTYSEDGQIAITSDLTITGEDKTTTTIKPLHDTGSSGDSRGWFLVNSGVQFNLSDVTLDGTGRLVYQGVRHIGEGTFDDVVFNEIKFNESGPHYSGVAVAAFGTGPVHFTDCSFTEIGRIGVLYFGSGGSGSTFLRNSYTGKGVGDWLDYALDISAGITVTVEDNTISGNRGVASSDGSTSAGILVTTHYGTGTAATVDGNIITDSTVGVHVGYDGSDASTVTVTDCDLSGNDTAVTSTAPHVDAEGNWYGSAAAGDVAGAVSGDVDYSPWYAAVPGTTPMPYGTDDSIQDAIDAASSGATIDVAAGTYREQIKIDGKSLDLVGAGVSSTIVEAVDTGSRTTYVITQWNASVKTIDACIGVVGPGTVNISDLTVDGRDLGPENFFGIHFFDTSGSVTGCRIENIEYPASPGAQKVASLVATHGVDVVAYTIDFSDNVIPNMQKGGILVMGPYITFTVDDNEITDTPSDIIAGNGIQLSYGATGTTSGNVVQGVAYSGTSWAATGILLFESGDVSMSGDVVHGCESGIAYDAMAFIYTHPSAVNLSFTDLDLYENEWTLGAVLMHDGADLNFTATDCSVDASSGDGIDLYGYTGWDNGSLVADITGCTITNTTLDGIWIDDLSGNTNNFDISVHQTGFWGNSGSALWNGHTDEVDAEYCWWDDPAGPTVIMEPPRAGQPAAPCVSPYGADLPEQGEPRYAERSSNRAGDGVHGNVDYTPWLTGNIVCVPDPLDLVVGSTTGSIDVDYLGGGGGLLYGYSVTVTWDDSVADLTSITQGSLLSDAGGTSFFYYGTGGTRTIDCALTGGSAGVTGPGTLFTLAFTEDNSGTSTVVLSPVAFRDNANAPLSGFYVDDGLINVDVAGPVFTDVSLANLTLGHTDDYAKNTDNLELTADVTDDYSLIREDIVADLSGLISGGGTAVVAQFYSSGVATWTAALANVTLTTDGLQSVTVTATDWLGNSASDSDGIIVDNTLPGNVTGFAAAPAHEEGILSWTDPTSPSLDANYYGIVVRYDAWGDYPYYDTGAPGYPGTPTAGDGEAFDGLGVVTGAVHVIVPRDIHYYSAFAYDWALNYGGVDAGGQDRCTNYWLGDVATTLGTWGYNGLVNPADIDKLGWHYGSAPSVGVPGDAECDVGPTDDHSRVGIPTPDDMIGFEDLMIFAMNYGVVSAKVVPFLGEPVVGDLALALVENGRTNGGVLELALRLEGNLGDVKGLTAELEFEGLEFLSARLSDDMSVPVGDMFFWSNVTSRGVQVDAAVLGTDVTIGGSGDVVLLTFQVLDETYSVDFASAELRGAANEDLTAELEGLSSDGVPVAFKLIQNAPNPFNPVTKVAYHVPSESRVTIRVFDVTGRLVTTLVDGVVEPGRHAAVWNGTNDRGESVGSGVYFCTMETPDYSSSHKMTLLK